MKRSLLDSWIEALESGRYRKGRGKLRSLDDEYCCLGVLCAVMGLKSQGISTSVGRIGHIYDGSQLSLSDRLVKELGFADTVASPLGSVGTASGCLANLNDKSSDFEPVVRELRENPERYFRVEEDIPTAT